MKLIFEKSRMAGTNKKLNQSLDTSLDVNYDIDQTDTSYLNTERDPGEVDYRAARKAEVELENFDAKADLLEFLRQLYKVSERVDSGGLLLKDVFGEFGMDDSE